MYLNISQDIKGLVREKKLEKSQKSDMFRPTVITGYHGYQDIVYTPDILSCHPFISIYKIPLVPYIFSNLK